MEKDNRSSFTGKIGFILAAAGSAVGLGNIWRFPYLAAKHGGGIFLLVYVVLAITLGFGLMAAEIAIGRKTGLSVIGAYKKLDKRFSFIGYISAFIPMIILPYYSVIGGWVVKYLVGFISGQDKLMAADTYFGNYIGSNFEPAMWFFFFIAATAIVVLFGVEKGVERVSKVMMPILVLLTLFIAGYVVFAIPGAFGGVKYYLKPDFSKLSFKTVLGAMGQLFYSMSLAMGIMVTYGSYMKKDLSIEKSVRQIEFFDTAIAFLAGLMIIPAVYVFSNGDPEAINKGPGLMFITLPQVFETMPGGRYIGVAFFLMVLFAAITSSISLMETVVSIFQDKFKMKRGYASLLVFGISIALGLVSSLGYGVWGGLKILGLQMLDFFDVLSNSVLMPIVAFCTCIFVGYFIKPKTLIDEMEESGPFKQKKFFSFIIKYLAPICIVLILVSSVLEAFGFLKY